MRIKRGYLMFFLTLFLLALSSIMVTSNIYTREQNEKLSRGYYTENAYYITLSGIEGETSLEAWLQEDIVQKCTIYRTSVLKKIDCRGVAFGDSADLPPLRSGRFFTSEESQSAQKLAVAGEMFMEQAVTRNGEKWLEIDGTEYRVVGVLGKRSQTRLDSMVFLPLGTVVSLYGADGKYIVDGEKENIRTVCDAFSKKWTDKVTDKEPVRHQSVSIGDVEAEGTSQTMFMVYFAVLFSFLLTVASCMMFWMDYRRQRLKVMWVFGCSDGEIARCMVICYLKVALPSVITAGVAAFALWSGGVMIDLRWVDFVFSFALTLLLGFSFLFICLFINKSFFHTFSKISHLLKNGILSIQFALFFWIFVQIVGYYVNLNSDAWIQTSKGEYSYFTLTLNDAESSYDEMLQAEDDPLYHIHVQNAVKKLEESQEFSYMVYTKEMVLRLDADTIAEHFGEDEYETFLRGCRYPGFFDSIPALKPQMEELDGIQQIAMSFCSVDSNAVEHYHLKVQEGRLFEPDDFEATKDQKEFPVILGAAYAPYFSLGDTFPFYVGSVVCTGRVVGILQENMRIITEMTHEDEGYPTLLDYDILLPFLSFEDLPEEDDMKSFAVENDTRRLLGVLTVEGEAGSLQSVEIQKEVNDIYRSESLFTVISNNATQGVWLFQSETRESVAILTILMFVVLGFQIFSLCVSLINKINRKLNCYSIQMMNGGTLGRIFGGYFLEIAGITLIGLAIAVFVMHGIVFNHMKYLLAMGAIWIGLLLLSSGVIWKKLDTIDMEVIMRRKDT